MATAYWVFEYIKVLLGYGALMYLWPQIVFFKHLRGKGLLYRFAFCTTVQPLVVSSVVLGLGLLHILNAWTTNIVIYGLLAGAVFHRLRLQDRHLDRVSRFSKGALGAKQLAVRVCAILLERLRQLWQGLMEAHGSRLREYIALAVLVAYGMLYFSWGSFQNFCYGCGDQYVHSQWIHELSQGNIFSAGVYPEAMHCFIYGIATIFGIRQYSVILLLQNVHIGATLIAAYCLMREIFRWKYTGFFVLMFFLTMRVSTVNEIYGMSRLQWTLPQEFGGPSLFLCVLFLLRYIKSASRAGFTWKDLRQLPKDENLLLFTTALAASSAIHFYVTMIAFFIGISVALCHVKKLFTKEKLLSLSAAVLCGIFVAVLPMGVALAQGKPLQGSMGWAMNIISGQDAESLAQLDPEFEEFAGNEEAKGLARLVGPVARSLNILNQYGYQELYPKGGTIFIGFTVAAAVAVGIWAISFPFWWKKSKERIENGKLNQNSFQDHLIFVLASVIFMILYTAPYLGIPELIARVRLCSTEHLLLIAVCFILFDMAFSFLACWGERAALKTVSALCGFGIWLAALQLGYYHDYLFGECSRYNGAVMVTESILQTLPENTYTVVSPTDELYHIIDRGWHEELLDFVQKVQGDNYVLPTQNIFIFVEKKPLRYGQRHFYQGPAWLAADGSNVNESHGDQYETVALSEGDSVKVMELKRGSDEAYLEAESRAAVENAAYQWCQEFKKLYPYNMNVYYEDDNFVCYHFQQEASAPYQLSLYA